MDKSIPPDRSLLDPEVLRDVIQGLAATDVDELEISQGSARIYVRREPGRRGATPVLEHAAEVRDAIPIKAPLAGVLYTRPSPEEPPFVVVGDPVESGQVVALIETMKLFNEVAADIAGDVISLPVSEGTLVEAGQPLLYVRPRESGGV
jgi:acetyl-CoA carboxylase biotin carboxyl carrier protein